MILNGCNILITVLVGLTGYTNDIEWTMNISSLRTVKIQCMPERLVCKHTEGMGLACPSPFYLHLQISSSVYC